MAIRFFRPRKMSFDQAPEQPAGTISTGQLPGGERIDELLATAHDLFATDHTGEVADYIPALASADPDTFGLCIVEANGTIHQEGDCDQEFSIQSISKAFVFALVCESLGHRRVRELVGANNTGLPFNSVMALELNDGNPMNPMVNAGALVTTALVPGADAGEKWDFIASGLAKFAGRDLIVDEVVYASEAATNRRNRALAFLLDGAERMPFDPIETVDLYTRQCSLLASTRDLGIMAATLAAGGTNPVTGERVVSAAVARDTLTIMASSGLYEMSGDWLYEVGMPGKSGVSGGIITASPGKGGLASYSPRLDSAGNSVRGKNATRYLSQSLGLDIFVSRPTG